MPAPKTKRPKKKAATPIHVENFGCVTELRFRNGGWARVQINSLEVRKFQEALQRYTLRKQKIPDPKVLDAIDTLHKFFMPGGPRSDVCVTADMILSMYGVSLEPICPPFEQVLKWHEEDMEKLRRSDALRRKKA
jgi:hypothetical protein